MLIAGGGLFFLGWGMGGFFWRLARGRAGGRGSTIAVRSLRSGLPLRHLRHCLWQFLQIPLGASTPLAPRPAPAPGSGFDTSPPLGRGVCLAFFCRAVWRWRILRGRQKRPRGRPFLALGCLAGAGGAARGWGRGRVGWRLGCLTLPWRVFLPRLPIRRFRPLPRRLPLRAFLLSSFSFSAAPASCRGTGGCRTGSGSLPSEPW